MKFLDTNAILIEIPSEKFAISSITLDELEHIKTSANKDEGVKFAARQVLRKLDSGEVEYDVIIYKEKMLRPLLRAGLADTNDAKIIACALSLGPQVEFITNDLACKSIAKMFIKNVYSFGEKREEEYTGYKEIIMTDEEMCDFYSDLSINKYNLLPNEYIIIRDSSGTIVDQYCWTGIEFRKLKTRSFYSDYFGEVKAMKGDIYQKMAIDSLNNNQMTVIRGLPGSGKSYLGLGYLMSMLDNGKIDKIIMFVNPVATKDSCKFGFLPGTLLEKILGSQIGTFLSSKLGGIEGVYTLINEGKLEFVALADSRG